MLFTIKTPLGYSIHTSKIYWQYIVEIKHPCMLGKENIVKEILSNPEEIRKSTTDTTVYLYYRNADRLYCAAVKHDPTTRKGFLITTYPTDKIKEGVVIWTK